jgi:hypothetical protein
VGLDPATSTRAMFEEHFGAADHAYPVVRSVWCHVDLVESAAILI